MEYAKAKRKMWVSGETVALEWSSALDQVCGERKEALGFWGLEVNVVSEVVREARAVGERVPMW